MLRFSSIMLMVVLSLLCWSVAPKVRADTVTVAVAANFQFVMQTLEPDFTASGHKLVVVPGSTGKLYAQIRNGAPFDVFLSADAATPERLVREGLGLADTRVTYALGRLVLLGRKGGLADCQTGLQKGQWERLALANPKLAPFGQAAWQVLKSLGLEPARISKKISLTENITQSLQMVMSSNVDLAFVAQGQVTQAVQQEVGCQWAIPAARHNPIVQQMVVLKHGMHNLAAHAFFSFLQGPQARQIIQRNGYGLP